jgi:hypothetical protein
MEGAGEAEGIRLGREAEAEGGAVGEDHPSVAAATDEATTMATGEQEEEPPTGGGTPEEEAEEATGRGLSRGGETRGPRASKRVELAGLERADNASRVVSESKTLRPELS